MASLFGYRNKSIPISDKAWSKLEQAEKRAQLDASESKNAESYVKPNDSPVADEVFEELFLKLAESASLSWLQGKIIEFAQEAMNGDEKAGKIVAHLSPIVARRLYPEKYLPTENP